MTLAPPENSDPDEAELGAAGEPATDDVIRPVVRQRSAQKRRKRRRMVVIAQGVVTAVFVIVLIGLAYAGWNAALRITGGDSNEVTDPAAPGYVAAAKPTSVTLIAFTGDAVPTPTTTTVAADGSAGDPGQAASSATPSTDATVPSLATMLLVIERSGDAGRTLVPIPAVTTLWDFEDSGPDSAANIFASGGIDVLRLRLGADLSFGSTAAVSAPVSMIGDLAAAVGPVTISLPDDVLQGTSEEDASVKYAAGQLTLEPGQVAEFMSFFGLGESESNRALRQQLVWEAMITASAQSGTELSLPADGDDAMAAAEVLSGAATADTRFDLVPLLAVPLNVTPPVTLYRIDQMAMPTWVASEVPFPISAFPGQRARVELLNGTTEPAALQSVAPKVVGANGEISFTGNAESFEVATSRVEYSSDEAQVAAEQIATALGLTATRNPDAASNVDVVVVVGADQLSQG
jgi:hypothetical protein